MKTFQELIETSKRIEGMNRALKVLESGKPYVPTREDFERARIRDDFQKRLDNFKEFNDIYGED